jgi:glycosyltransferase involved in cell wall biosynthesis
MARAREYRSPRIALVAPPLVSVVVSTHNRPERLARLLDSLRAQALATDSFEVVVVDDGSGPATQAALAEQSARPGLRLRTLRSPTKGPAPARNAGWRTAQATLIAFTDDDCVADPRWLAEALAAAGRHPGAIIQGRTLPDPTERDTHGLLSRTVKVEVLGPQYETCNIFYPRAVLAALGGFDEAFGSGPAAEDTDLAWRAIEAGHETAFASQALVFHAVQRLGVSGMLRVATRWGAATRVIADHPQTRSMLYRGVFWNVWHYLVLRSLLALPAPRWLRRMVLTRHLLELHRRAREGGAGAAAIPFLLLHDAVEFIAVTRGALRYRTLVF